MPPKSKSGCATLGNLEGRLNSPLKKGSGVFSGFKNINKKRPEKTPAAIPFGTVFAPQDNCENLFFLGKLPLRQGPSGRIYGCMSRCQRNNICDSDIVGLKYFDRLVPLLQRLHDVGTQRDRAGNRQLFYDQYCAFVLLFLFNPIVTSLRGIQNASELKKVQKKLGCPRASLGSLSEATQVFEPERLKEIVQELAGQLQPCSQDRRFPEVKQLLTAVDGTVVKTLSRIVQAAYLRSPTDGRSLSAWRLHTHFEIERGLPTRMDVTGAANQGQADERAVLRRALESDRCYVMDRGYAQFSLFNAIVAAKSAYVCRVRDNSVYAVMEQRPLSSEAIQAGVVFDAVVRMGQDRTASDQPQHPVRLICIQTTPHEKRGVREGGRNRPGSDGLLRIATNLLDVPADVIGFIYQRRWTIEIFFRFLKHILGCRHLLSTDPVGVEIQAYCAIIACLLIALWTGKQPTRRTYEMICFYFIGWADEEELLNHLAKLKVQTV
jgi:Transposase DDE domain